MPPPAHVIDVGRQAGNTQSRRATVTKETNVTEQSNIPQAAVEYAEKAAAEVKEAVEQSKKLTAKGAKASAKKNGTKVAGDVKDKLAAKGANGKSAKAATVRKTVNADGSPLVRAPRGYLIVEHAWKVGKEEVTGWGLKFGGNADPVIAKNTSKLPLRELALAQIAKREADAEKAKAKTAPKAAALKGKKAKPTAEPTADIPQPAMPAAE